MTRQVNVFVENKPGRLRRITSILRDEDINIRAVEIQDRGDYGVIKLLVSDPRKAQLALGEAGLACALRNILAIVIEDRPGALCELAGCFDENGINIADAYGFILESRKKAVWCVEVENPGEAARVMERHGFRILEEDELYEL